MLLLLSVFFSGSILGQHTFTPINMQEVKELTTNPSKPTYYPILLQRFNAFDDSLTKSDYRLIYYGFVFQKGYDYNLHQREEEIRELIRVRKYTEAAKLCDTVLSAIPVSLIANQLMASALYNKNSDDPDAIPYRTRYRRLRDAILDSGDGFRCQSAFTIIFYEDRFDIIRHHFEITQYQLVQPKTPSLCDEYTMTPSKYYNSPKICFNNFAGLQGMIGIKK